MQAEQLEQLMLQKNDINIFDIFAILYAYCNARFSAIERSLRQVDIYRAVESKALYFENTVLPPIERCLFPLDLESRTLLLSKLRNTDNQNSNELQFYAVLRAIDSAYGNMVAGSRNRWNFTELPPQLNLNTDLGRVYHKQPSPVYPLIERHFGEYFAPGRKANWIRKGIDVGVPNLRYYLDHFACLRNTNGYDVDFGVLDSSISQCFPADLAECRIGLVPLIDQFEQFDIKCFDLDSQNKTPFRFMGLKEPKRVANEAIAALKRLSDKGATIVILPELCVPGVVRKAIADGLKNDLFPNVKMVIAGSFHDQHQQGSDWCNIAYVLGPGGQQLWQQKKMQPYTCMHYEAQRISYLANLANSDLHEDISTSDPIIVVRDTPLGRMVVLICRDLLPNHVYQEILFDLGVNFICTPALCSTLEPEFTLAAYRFAVQSQAITLLSSACAPARESHAGINSLVKVSFAIFPGFPAVRWFYCDIPPGECTYRKCSDDFIVQLGDWPRRFEPI